MSDMFSRLAEYLGYPFVRYSLIVGVLISLCTSLFGVPLVLKRFSFIGDGLSHTAFGAIAVATILKLTDSNLLVMPVTIICAVILLWMNNSSKVKGDASLAVISVTSMAAGYFLMNVFSANSNVSEVTPERFTSTV